MERTARMIGVHRGRQPKAIGEERRRVLEAILRERWRALQELPAELMGPSDPPDDSARQIQEEIVRTVLGLSGAPRGEGGARACREKLLRMRSEHWVVDGERGISAPIGRRASTGFVVSSAGRLIPGAGESSP
jgi:hypothetical protein